MADIIVIHTEWMGARSRPSRSGGSFCCLTEGTSLGGDSFCYTRGRPSPAVTISAMLSSHPAGTLLSRLCRLLLFCKADLSGYPISALRPARTRQTWITSFWSRFIPCHGERPAPAPMCLLCCPATLAKRRIIYSRQGGPSPRRDYPYESSAQVFPSRARNFLRITYAHSV